MDERVVKLNEGFKRYQEKMADLRHQQVVAADAFGKRAVGRKVADIRKKIFGYESERGERAGNN